MKSKWIKRTAICLAAALAFSGCGAKNVVSVEPEIAGEITTITFFGNKYEPENVRVIEEIISDFMVENPDIRVSYESLKGSDYYVALEKRLAAGKGDDVFMVNHDTLLTLEAGGRVAELTQLALTAGYTEQMLDQMTDGGKIFWLPTTVSAFGLYCNLDLLKAHGQQVPETLAEWKAVCDYFVAQGITPVVANNDISLKTLAIGAGFCEAYQDGTAPQAFARLNRGEEQLSAFLGAGFSLVKEFIDKGYVDAEKALNTKKTSSDLAEFVQGKAPFMLTGAWAAGRLKEMAPGSRFEVTPLPVLEEGALLVLNADTRLGLNAASPNQEAALKFIEYFIRPENIEKFADQQCSFSPLNEKSEPSLKELRPLLACYEDGPTVIGTDGRLELQIWELTAQATQKLLAGEPLQQVMQWMDQQAAAESGGAE